MKRFASEYIGLLIAKSLCGSLTKDEQQDLECWLNMHEANRAKFAELTDHDQLLNKLRDWRAAGDIKKQAVNWQKIEADLKPMAKPRSLLRRVGWVKIAAAVGMLVVMSVFIYTIGKRSIPDAAAPVHTPKKVIAPGGNKAVLTLADGRTILLDSAANGFIAGQGETMISKSADGKLEYMVGPERSRRTKPGAPSEAEAPGLLNTISIPRGGQYQLTLPDGTRVWLNSESSLQYPVSFTGDRRVVRLSGEAYFEVAHVTRDGVRVPFEVAVDNGMKLDVLGTSFNVMAYKDEKQAKITLVNGSVKVETGAAQTPAAVFLHPGQQALLSMADSSLTVKRAANIEEAIAWKEGKFKFDRTELSVVMRSLSRWYNVEFEIEKGVPQKFFTGEISRRLHGSEALEIVEFANVHCKVEGNKLVVMP